MCNFLVLPSAPHSHIRRNYKQFPAFSMPLHASAWPSGWLLFVCLFVFFFQGVKPQSCRAKGSWLIEEEREEWNTSAQVTPLMGTFLEGWKLYKQKNVQSTLAQFRTIKTSIKNVITLCIAQWVAVHELSRECTWWDLNVRHLLSQLIEEPGFISKNEEQGIKNSISLAKTSISNLFWLNIQWLQTVFFPISKFLMFVLQDRHKLETGVSICTCKILICICKRVKVHRIVIMMKRISLDRNGRLLISEDPYLHTIPNWKVLYFHV